MPGETHCGKRGKKSRMEKSSLARIPAQPPDKKSHARRQNHSKQPRRTEQSRKRGMHGQRRYFGPGKERTQSQSPMWLRRFHLKQRMGPRVKTKNGRLFTPSAMLRTASLAPNDVLSRLGHCPLLSHIHCARHFPWESFCTSVCLLPVYVHLNRVSSGVEASLLHNLAAYPSLGICSPFVP